jgi:hypothetical protein
MRGTKRWSRHLIPITVYLVGFCLFAFQSFDTFTTHLISVGNDGSQGMWSYWWMRYALANGVAPWQTDYLYHPDGVTLFGAVLIPFNGVASIPLCWFVGQVTAYNLLIVFSFVATG